MAIFDEFIEKKTDPSGRHFLKRIRDYCDVKFEANSRELEYISQNDLTYIIYEAEKKPLTERDIRFFCLIQNFYLIGITLVDDLVDNEITPIWENVSPGIIFNIACNFSLVYPSTLILKSSYIPKALRLKLIATLAEYYLKISAGEYEQDFNSNNIHNNITLKDVFQTMIYKTGEWHALGAAICLCYLNQIVYPDHPFITFARELGVLKQLKNDMGDVFKSEFSNDIVNGIFNFPIAAYYLSADTEKKKKILAELERCKQGIMTTHEFRQHMIDDAQLTFCNLIVDAQKNKVMDVIEQMDIPQKLKIKFINLVAS